MYPHQAVPKPHQRVIQLPYTLSIPSCRWCVSDADTAASIYRDGVQRSSAAAASMFCVFQEVGQYEAGSGSVRDSCFTVPMASLPVTLTNTMELI